MLTSIRQKDRLCVVLADPPASGTNPNATAFPNLGLLYLAGYLREHLPGVAIHYVNCFSSVSEHVAKVQALAPAIYGISLASPFAELGYRVIAQLKQTMPSLPVICGGPHPTAAAEEVLTRSRADVCCLGEGEQTFLELVSAFWRGDSLLNIPGTAYRTQSGRIALAPARRPIMDLDEIPFPAWDLIDFSAYSGCRKARGQPSTAIIASRGCPYHCVFCSNPVWRHEEPWLRLRSPANIALEVQLLYERGIRELSIISDEMNPEIRWAIAVFDALAALKLEGLHLQCQLRAKPVTRELAAAMKRAGCWLCHIGVESSSPRVLKGIGKHITAADVESAARALKASGMKTYAFIMLYQVWETGAKLEVESTAEVMRTLLFVLKMRLRGLIDFMSCGFTTSYPGSDLHAITLRHNLCRVQPASLDVLTPQDITLQLPGIPKWQMALSRTVGLLMQGALFLLAVDTYRPLTLRQNLRHANYKLRYLLGLR